jgi:hypothetical protein
MLRHPNDKYIFDDDFLDEKRNSVLEFVEPPYGYEMIHINEQGLSREYRSGDYCFVGIEHPSRKDYFYETCGVCGADKFLKKGEESRTDVYDEYIEADVDEEAFIKAEMAEALKWPSKCSNKVCEEAKLFWVKRHPIQERLNELGVSGGHALERSRFANKTPHIDYEDGGYIYAAIGLYHAEARYRERLSRECDNKRYPLTKEERRLGAFVRNSQLPKKKLGFQEGENNSQYGTCWVYSENLKKDKKISKSDLKLWLGMGWEKGRKTIYYRYKDKDSSNDLKKLWVV